MNVKNISANVTEVGTSKATVLFSYGTPVAAFILGRGYVKTNEYWSVTTSKHINMWLRSKGREPKNTEEVEQSYLNSLV